MVFYLAMLFLLLLFSDDICVGGWGGSRFLCVEEVLRSTWVDGVGDGEMHIHMCREVLPCLVVS